MKISLRNRFLLPTIILIVIAFTASTLVSYFSASSALESAAESEIRQVSKLNARLLEWWIGDRQKDIATWSTQKVYLDSMQDTFMGKASRKKANAELASLLKNYKYYETINLVNSKGEIIASSNIEKVKGLNLADRGYFKTAMQGKDGISPVLVSRATNNPIFVISSPVRIRDQVVGALIGVVDLGFFNKTFIDTLKLGESGYAYMYDQDGRIVAHPDKTQILKLNMNEFDFGKRMISQGSGVIVYEYKGVTKTVAFDKVPGINWTVAAAMANDELLASAHRIGYINLILAVASVLVVGLIIFFISAGISKSLKAIADGLNQGAVQVADASSQMASASQQLAEGSSQQASSLEESSASLEEMAAMTRQNADSAQQADTLMRQTNQLIENATSAMGELTTAMHDISEASENTSKIIKTIDEIAFQTNLLALNAAVEAARAGEAGAGFAVVADEVRNLAMRAAEAARSTAELIEGTVEKVKGGAQLVETTAAGFAEVDENTDKVGELVGEIAAASNEQAQGIDQVNTAIAQMDKMTQNNAANAEESAASSEEMNAQAESMKAFVSSLVALVEGSSDSLNTAQYKSPKPPRAAAKPAKPAKVPAKAPQKTAAKAKAPAKAIAPPAQNKGEAKPEDVIPFDDDMDFQDF